MQAAAHRLAWQQAAKRAGCLAWDLHCVLHAQICLQHRNMHMHGLHCSLSTCTTVNVPHLWDAIVCAGHLQGQAVAYGLARQQVA